jgi:DnaJ-class molecular chaperone
MSLLRLGHCTCGNCDGKSVIVCRFCGGKGTRTIHKLIDSSAQPNETCKVCNGTGVRPCPNHNCEAGIVRV